MPTDWPHPGEPPRKPPSIWPTGVILVLAWGLAILVSKCPN
jgi:hypothetical protein